MTVLEQIALAPMFYFGQVFVFCMLINKDVLEWFLLIMCREHTLDRYSKLLSRKRTTFCFLLRRNKVDRFPVLIKFMIRSNCRESYNKFLLLLLSYSFNLLTEVSVQNSSGQSLLKAYFRKKQPSILRKNELSIFISSSR